MKDVIKITCKPLSRNFYVFHYFLFFFFLFGGGGARVRVRFFVTNSPV